MNRLLTGSFVVVALALAMGCEECPPSQMTETTLLSLEGPQGDRVELGIPLDLTPVETALHALNAGGGGGLFNVEMVAGQQFNTYIEGALGGFAVSSGIPGGFGAMAPIAGKFSAVSGCDIGAAVCQFGQTACQYLPQLVTKFAEDKTGALDGFDAATCSQSLCGGQDLIDLSEVPPAFACAASGVLTCVSAQLPTVVGILMTVDPNGENAGLEEALSLAAAELASCLGAYADSLGGLLDVEDSPGTSSTDPWSI